MRIVESGKIYLGRLTPGLTRLEEGVKGETGQAWLNWELKEAPQGFEFSATGDVWDSRHKDIVAGGQIVAQLAELFPENQQAQILCEVWKHWHLNTMHAGTPEQEKALGKSEEELADLTRAHAVAAKKNPPLYQSFAGLFYDEDLKSPNWYALARHVGYASHYDWACASLREAGLYEVPYSEEVEKATNTMGQPHPETYAYGHGWLYQPLPEDVLDTIRRNFVSTPEPSMAQP